MYTVKKIVKPNKIGIVFNVSVNTLQTIIKVHLEVAW